MEKNENNRWKILTVALIVLSVLFSMPGIVTMTQLGQMLALPNEWVFNYFRYRPVFLSLMLLTFIAAAVINFKFRIFRLRLSIIGIFCEAFAIFLSVFFISYSMFPSQHLRSEYVPVSEFELSEDAINIGTRIDEVVYVIEYMGDSVAFPRNTLAIPHLAGVELAGKEILLANCVLSNLALAYDPSFNGEETDFRVQAQVNNNLTMFDANTGEIFSQFTGESVFEDSTAKFPESYPIQMMPFDSYKLLYPDGKVYAKNELGAFSWIWTGPAMPKLVDLFEKGKPVYNTLPLDDHRLPQQEQVFGVQFNSESVAYTRDYLLNKGIINTKVGSKDIVLVYFDEYDTIGLFDRNLNGKTISIENMNEIDPYGNTGMGRLKRLDMFSGVFWMIWSFNNPDTVLFK